MIVFFLVLVTTRTLWEVNANPPSPQPDDQALFVTVVGHQWWWEYRYETCNGRNSGFTTANELHIPVSRTGAVRPTLPRPRIGRCLPQLLGAAVGRQGRPDPRPHQHAAACSRTRSGCSSASVPNTAGRSMRTCCFAWSSIRRPSFDRWLAAASAAGGREIRRPATASERFLAQSCVNCHAVRGTPAVGNYAPDLTHLMSRETLAVGRDRKYARKSGPLGSRSAVDQARLPDAGVWLADRDQELIVRLFIDAALGRSGYSFLGHFACRWPNQQRRSSSPG